MAVDPTLFKYTLVGLMGSVHLRLLTRFYAASVQPEYPSVLQHPPCMPPQAPPSTDTPCVPQYDYIAQGQQHYHYKAVLSSTI